MNIKTIAFMIILSVPLPVSGQDGSISGHVFGDYYAQLLHNDEDIRRYNGFWFRQIYFTYDNSIKDNFLLRFRLEGNSPGDFTTNTTLDPFIKDASISWQKGDHTITLGLAPSPTIFLVNKTWGYRHVEKTAAHLFRFGSTRDTGIGIKGPLSKSKNIDYWFMIGNGSGTKSEINKEKNAMLSLTFHVTDNILFDAYADWRGYPGAFDQYTMQAFAAYKDPTFTLGTQFMHQTRQNGNGNENLNYKLLSFFYTQKLSQKLTLLARSDISFDPVPEAGKIAYLKISSDSKLKFFLFGIDYSMNNNVHIIPNLEIITYGNTPDEDSEPELMSRITYYYKW